MLSRLAADLLVVCHFGFIIFVLIGGVLILKWRRVVFLHLPAVVWAALIEFQGWICPLTPLEQAFRMTAGEAGYTGGFIEHYLLPVIYPDALTHEIQSVLGAVVVAINLAVYGWLLLRLYGVKKG